MPSRAHRAIDTTETARLGSRISHRNYASPATILRPVDGQDEVAGGYPDLRDGLAVKKSRNELERVQLDSVCTIAHALQVTHLPACSRESPRALLCRDQITISAPYCGTEATSLPT
jgi:hypothetical protein